MTRSWRGLARRSNGSMVTRSTSIAVRRRRRRRSPARAAARSPRTRSASPPRCRAAARSGASFGHAFSSGSTEPRQVVAQAARATTASRAGRRSPTRRARAGSPCSASSSANARVLGSDRVGSTSKAPWPTTSSRLSRSRSQSRWSPCEVADVGHRVVEVGRVALLAPGLPGGRVVVAREAQRQREQVGVLEREVGRVVGAEAAAQGGDLHRAAAVVARSTARPCSMIQDSYSPCRRARSSIGTPWSDQV